jgi:flagellar biosynthetic protein FliR
MTLNDFMLSEVFTFLLVFCRIGSAIMTLPGFGEAYISARIRLLLAVMISLVITPAIKDFPAPPDTIFALVSIMGAELLTGIFIGTIARLLISAISIAGMVIAYQSSLASALVQDVTTSGAQASSMGNLMGITALTLIFATDMHHLILRSLLDSYSIFHVGLFPNIADFTEHAVRTTSASFVMALQLSAPHIVIGLIVYLAGGIIARVMPSFQVFFVLIAPNLIISFFVLMIAFNSMMMWYMEYFQNGIARFIRSP